MKRQVVSNLGSNYLLSFVGMALGFFLVPFLIVKLGAELYGIIVLSESTILFSEVLTVSLRQGLSRHATFALSQDRYEEFLQFLATGRRLLYFVAAAVLSFGIALSFAFPVLFKVPAGYEMQSQVHFALITLGFVLSIPNSVFWSALYAKQRFDLINFSTSFGLIMRAFCIFAYFSLVKDPNALISYGLIFVVMTATQNTMIRRWSRKIYPDMKLNARYFRKEKMREILAFSTHTSLVRVGVLLYQNAANILINIFWGPAMNAVQSVAIKLPQMVYRIFIETSWTLTPTFTDMAARNERQKAAELFFGFSKMLAIITYPLLWTLMALSQPLIRLWVGDEMSLAGSLMPLYIVPLFMHIPASVTGCILNAYARIKLPSRLNLIVAVLNLVLAYVLGVTFGLKLYGIAIAFMVSTMTLNLGFYPVYACRILGVRSVRFYSAVLVKPFAWAAVTIGGAFLLTDPLRPEGALEWRSAIVVAAAVALYYAGSWRFLLKDSERAHMKEILGQVRNKLNKSPEKETIEQA